ncbi:Arc family DNA-binding protein (plasmid) [Weissella cibaria]|uniref:Arc family DNA-binding protein n=1 Tax=Weissella cibaria TaxID=137591 RepID=UPI0005E966BF|nr:Arc family DNA-binding protein [Weissella cibaria]MBZ6070739.1 Arc family DNA-binding protein [Weissella cibaria]COJ70382.1 Uncharacterised protein [Streptococcus pneumoniae]
MANYPLRIPSQLMDNIRSISDYDGRSVNKEIEFILSRYVDNLKSNEEYTDIFQRR